VCAQEVAVRHLWHEVFRLPDRRDCFLSILKRLRARQGDGALTLLLIEIPVEPDETSDWKSRDAAEFRETLMHRLAFAVRETPELIRFGEATLVQIP
jgi:hypothetical protein